MKKVGALALDFGVVYNSVERVSGEHLYIERTFSLSTNFFHSLGGNGLAVRRLMIVVPKE